MTDYLTAEQIAAAVDLPEEDLDIPEWGGKVRVRGLTKAEQQSIRREARVDGTVDDDLLELLLCVHGVVEPHLTVEDASLLRGKSAAAVDRVMTRIAVLNIGTPQAQEEAKRRFRSRS